MEKEKVLVVDDDAALVRMILAALQRFGFRAEGATNGVDALEMLKTNLDQPFAILVTDLMMPAMDGITLLRKARQLDPAIEVIVITAVGTLESAISALRANGAYDFLLKPFESMDQLGVAVERAATHRRLIREREALQAKVRDDAERLQVLIANTGDAILSADEHGVLTIVNPAAARLLGADNLVGKAALSSLPDRLVKVITNWQAVSPQYPAIIEVPWADGSVQMVNLTPITRSDGSLQGWVIVLRDITHLKRLDELKTKMLIETANRIHLPLAKAVNTLAELDLLASGDERIAGAVYRLTNLWKQIRELGEEFASLAQADTDLVIRPVPVEPGPLLEEFKGSMVDGLQKDTSLSIVLRMDDDLPRVRADPDLLRQILKALVSRAASRSKWGGEIHVYAREFEGQVWIDIHDDGPAVSEEELPHIFEQSFVRLEGTPDSAGPGLAIAKAFMDRMGGQVWVSGQGPKGSTITICLPMLSPQGS